MPATNPRVWPGAACAALLSIGLAAPPVAAVAPTPTPPTLSTPGWVDEAVRSRSVACSTAVRGIPTDDASEVLEEHLACTLKMSDPRAGGELSADLTVTFTPAAAAAGTWVGTFTLDGGLHPWTGTGHGAAVRLPDAAPPGLFGEVQYWGSGGFSGLTYTQLLSFGASPVEVSGWINGPLVPEFYARLAVLPSLWVDAAVLGGRRH